MAVGEAPLPNFFPIAGVKLGIVEAGIRYQNRKDLVLIELVKGSACAGVFTQNAFCAAPVLLCKKHLEAGINTAQPSYLIINTGNANAGTGSQGYEDALETCKAVAELAHVDVENVLPFSTGVIGERLPMDTLLAGVSPAFDDLAEHHWEQAAEGIMTTDTRPKGASRQLNFGGREINISGMSKGAGMIKPNMATMLAYIGTDARIEQTLLRELVQELAELSFNRISIDGDTSTNDSCMLFATGVSDAGEITRDHPDFAVFFLALKQVFQELAQAIVKDGEGATKFVSIEVHEAKTSQEALDVAYTVAHSPLVKTALYASDPNWGRILAAVGRAPVEDFDLSAIAIYLDDVCLISNGEPDPSYDEAMGQKVMDQTELSIVINLGRGRAEETIWTSDLSHEYVTINAEYRS